MTDIPRDFRQIAFVTAGLLAACTPLGPDNASLLDAAEHGPALLAFYGDTTLVQIEPTVRVGEVTTLRFTSFGGGCIRQDSSEVEVSGLKADIRPHRSELPPSTVCTAELRVDQNLAELRFGEPGQAHVRIVGLARPGNRPFVVDRDLMVLP